MSRAYRRVAFCLAAGLAAGCANGDLRSTAQGPGIATAAEGSANVAGSVDDEIVRLRAALAREVPQPTTPPMPEDQAWITRAAAAIAGAGHTVDHPQLIVVVDRAPAVQSLVIVAARPDRPWRLIGGSRVSTGQPGRHGYFITPTGVFVHDTSVLDYRALGTFNDNHIRGLGLRGSRVWDFGWHQAERGWLRDGGTADIRLLLHATDPVLEARLGRPASKGCVRIPAAMNRFLDLHGVLDADYERGAVTGPRLRAVLRPDRTPTPLAGTMLVIVDSGAGR